MKQTVSSEALQLVCSNYIRILTPHCSFAKMPWQRNRAFITEILFESKKNPPRPQMRQRSGRSLQGSVDRIYQRGFRLPTIRKDRLHIDDAVCGVKIIGLDVRLIIVIHGFSIRIETAACLVVK